MLTLIVELIQSFIWVSILFAIGMMLIATRMLGWLLFGLIRTIAAKSRPSAPSQQQYVFRGEIPSPRSDDGGRPS